MKNRLLSILFLIVFVLPLVLDAQMKLDPSKIKFPLTKARLGNVKLKTIKKKDDSKKEEDKKDSKKKKEKAASKKVVKKVETKKVRSSTPENDSSRKEGLTDTIKIESVHTNKPLPDDAKVWLDFQETPLADVIKWFSEKMQKNFILQERLSKAKITIMSPSSVTIKEAYKTFLTVLSVNNVTVVPNGKFTIVMTEKESVSTNIPYYGKQKSLPYTFLMVATVVRVVNTEAKEMQKVLNIFRGKGGSLLVFDEKTILIVDYAVNIRKMLKIVADLDTPRPETEIPEFFFVKLKYVTPSDAKKTLEEIFKPLSSQKTKRNKKSVDLPSLAEISNKSRSKASKDRRSKNRKLSEAPADDDVANFFHIVADDRSEQLVFLTTKANYKLAIGILSKIDTQVDGEGEVHVVPLQNAKAKDLVSTLSKVVQYKRSGKGSKSSSIFEGEVSLSADESTNSLVVVASLRDYKSLKNVIKELDQRRKQVFVEAIIMEVTVQESSEYGLAYGAGGFSADINGESVPIFFGKALTTPTPGFVSGMLSSSSVSDTEDIPGIGVFGGVPSVGMLLNAAKSDTNVNVMSTPHILTTDNEEAEITVGETVPFPSGTIINSTAGSTVTYTREDVALKLKIKPQINDGGYMTLDVEQEVTELGAQTSYGYITTKRSAKTIVNAENEQTIVIGGLMKDYVSEYENKIPLLGDIPILGNLFKYTTKSNKKSNLLLILTPHIIESTADFDRIYQKKTKEREEFAKKFYGTIKDIQNNVFMEKKRGMLLSLLQKVTSESKKESDIIETEINSNIDAKIITPDGKMEETQIKDDSFDYTNEEVPSIEDEDY